VNDDQEVAAQKVSQYNLLAIPVVDEHQNLLGVITVDDVIDIFEEEATEDIYHMAGLTEADRAFTPVGRKIRNRLPWAVMNLATAFMAASVVAFFQTTISKLAILAAYMPVIAGMGGNGGTQSMVVIIRSIALGEIEFSKASRAIMNETINGVVIGFVMGLIAGGIGYLVSGKMYLGIVVWISMCCNMLIAGLVGAIVPLTLKKMKFDPAVSSGIIVTAFTDTCGFFTFLGLATLFMDKF
jgi:magnesium transporter